MEEIRILKAFYPNGAVKKVSESYQNKNKLTGYYIDGGKKFIEYTVDGKLHNDGRNPAVIRYRTDGSVLSKIYFAIGRPVENDTLPSYVIYYCDGSVDTEVYHCDGKISRIILFRHDGSIESCITEDKLKKHINECKKCYGDDAQAYREYTD